MTELNDLRYTMFSIDGQRMSDEVHEISLKAKESGYAHYSELNLKRHNSYNLNMLTITFSPMFGCNRDGATRVMIADTFKYNGKHHIEIVATNTRECIRGIGYLTEKVEELAGDSWCGKQRWTFEMINIETLSLDPKDMPKQVNFDDALKIAKGIKE